MGLFEFILGPKCADCDCRIKGPKYPVTFAAATPGRRWMCQACKNKRDLEQQRRVEEERRRREAEQRCQEESRKAKEEADREERARKKQQAREEAERREKELRLAREEAERKERAEAMRLAEEQRLKAEEQRLKAEEQRLKAEERRLKAALFQSQIADEPHQMLDFVARMLQKNGVDDDDYGVMLAFLKGPFGLMEVPEDHYTSKAFERFCQLRSNAWPRARQGSSRTLYTRPEMGGTELAFYKVSEEDYFARTPFLERCVHLAVAGLAWWICQAVRNRRFWNYLEEKEKAYLEESLICMFATSLEFCPSFLRAEILKIIPYLPNAKWARSEVEWIMEYDKEPNNRFEASKVVAMIDPTYGPPKVRFKRRFFNED